MKHYLDIENLRETGNEFRRPNTGAFEFGDIISITEKIDGSNASFTREGDKLLAFSRKQELNFNKTLAGFWNWVQTLDPSVFDDRYIFFGEWLRKNKITYNKEAMNQFYLFDVYDKQVEGWVPQVYVENFARLYHLNYIEELYYGPFLSWDHCRNFMHKSAYGDQQEGVIVKNQTKLNDPLVREPVYLKLVNEKFKETMSKKSEPDPAKEAGKKAAQRLISTIVTPRRVEKMIFALRDEGVLSEVLEPKDMKTVAKYLPKRVYEDCLKEEPEVVQAAGEFGGKAISSLTMKIAREMILGE